MKKLPRSLVLAAFALALTFPLSRHVPAVSADSGQQGDLHIEKNCSAYTGDAGQYCTITSSNVRQIPPGSRVFYDQAAGDPDVPPPMLDSNVVLYVGTANWAVGRCSLDLTTYLGLCTFSDGVGPLTGFHARIDVSPAGGANYYWNGTYGCPSQGD